MKNKQKFLNISEVAKLIGLIDKKTGKTQTHTLRFWETKFKQLKPKLLSGNRRFYSQKDINVVKMINFLLRDKGLTITGAKKIMNNKINQLDDPISSSIKAEYYETKIKLKSKNILNRLKKLNG